MKTRDGWGPEMIGHYVRVLPAALTLACYIPVGIAIRNGNSGVAEC